MLPTFGAAKIIVVLLVAIFIIQSKQDKIMNEIDGTMYDDNYKMYAPANMIRLARFYTFYDKPSLKDEYAVSEGILDKRRDRPRPMRFGK
uniref:Uncharacterized protein n=1 Tax=Strongyloides venezuelensis TaxID=75913 RepID=A0A0K0F1M0_STRVS